MASSFAPEGCAPGPGQDAKGFRVAPLFRNPVILAGGLLASCAASAAEPLRLGPQGPTPTRIERSGRYEIGASPRPDASGEGALWIDADGLTIELVGPLEGAPPEAAPDELVGVGIRITGKGVTLRGARVSGYKVGIHAVGADGLVLEDCDVSGNFRQRLLSTPEKEAGEDWLDPHHNDAGEWRSKYGAGIHVERSRNVTVRRSRARQGQNGLVLERCEGARVYDNDFSFLSGWGIALWRTSDSVIARNACDFCVRGYSHGIYNRGQDSAGILVFEQCSRNVFAENSATHGGDGFFAFAGQEALGGVTPSTPDFDHRRKGNNDNLIVGNDLSYAAAHGLELTFGFGNSILANRLVGNAICGIWGGYSQDTTIAHNELAENGERGYGLERGGVNIEHGSGNRILANRFRRNACGVHLWWDPDEHLVSLPWARANGHRSADNTIAGNRFEGDTLAIQLRECDSTVVLANELVDVERPLELSGTPPTTEGTPLAAPAPPRLELPGESRPVGARPGLRGREHIRMDAWGPLEPALPGGS